MICVLVYLEDVNVYSKTFNDYLKDLEEVFNRLTKAALKLKKKKYVFFKKQLSYLGFLINKKGLCPQPNKVSNIENMKVPKDKKDIQFILQTDASHFAIGAVLSQIDENDVKHPVAYCNKTLNSHECNYTVTEHEYLAVIFACKQICVYIHGTMFEVATDHASLSWQQNLKDPEGCLARWALKLQEVDNLYSHMLVQDLLNLEPKVALLISRLCIDTVVKDGVLCKIIKGQRFIFSKLSVRVSFVISSHNEVRHFKFAKTIKHLCYQYYWESMTFDVTDIIKKCVNCQAHKPTLKTTVCFMVCPYFVWHTISNNVIGPLSSCSSRYKYIIIDTDGLTRLVEAKAIRDLGSVITAWFILEDIIYCSGCP